jgi:hypothetical protein
LSHWPGKVSERKEDDLVRGRPHRETVILMFWSDRELSLLKEIQKLEGICGLSSYC